jgi:hypothetical protein
LRMETQLVVTEASAPAASATAIKAETPDRRRRARINPKDES